MCPFTSLCSSWCVPFDASVHLWFLGCTHLRATRQTQLFVMRVGVYILSVYNATCSSASIQTELLPFTAPACTLHYALKSFTKLLPLHLFTCGSHECRSSRVHPGTCINSPGSLFWISLCCSGNCRAKYGNKRAKNSNQHHSRFAKSSISSCLIQRTLVFITSSCCTRDTEPTAAHN